MSLTALLIPGKLYRTEKYVSYVLFSSLEDVMSASHDERKYMPRLTSCFTQAILGQWRIRSRQGLRFESCAPTDLLIVLEVVPLNKHPQRYVRVLTSQGIVGWLDSPRLLREEIEL